MIVCQILAIIKHLKIYAFVKNESHNKVSRTEDFILQYSLNMTFLTLIPLIFLLWGLTIPKALTILFLFLTILDSLKILNFLAKANDLWFFPNSVKFTDVQCTYALLCTHIHIYVNKFICACVCVCVFG